MAHLPCYFSENCKIEQCLAFWSQKYFTLLSPPPPKRKNWTISRANKNLLDLKAQLLDLEILQNKDLHLFRDKNRLHIIQLNISSIYM